ncbi:MAG: hypothetical protein V1685_06070 [Parcubacteria group bacterium]
MRLPTGKRLGCYVILLLLLLIGYGVLQERSILSYNLSTERRNAERVYALGYEDCRSSGQEFSIR